MKLSMLHGVLQQELNTMVTSWLILKPPHVTQEEPVALPNAILGLAKQAWPCAPF